MANAIQTVDDLMKVTYDGYYAMQFFGMFPGLGMGGKAPSEGFQSQGVPARFAQPLEHQDLMKAEDPFLTTKTNYFNPNFGRAVTDWLNHEADIWKLLPKETYQSKGDSVFVVTADAINFRGQLETAAALGETDIPDVTQLTYTDPAVMYNHWDSSLIAQIKSMYQQSPGGNAAQFFKGYFLKKHASDLNAQLMQEAGTLAKLGGNFDNFIESIDRVCSDSAEEALLDAGDCDIHGFDRSASEAEAYNDINGGVLRNLQLGLLDDMIADCKKYSDAKRFIMLTDDVQINTIEALEGTKQRFSNQDGWKIDTVNGVQTRKGREIGFNVAAYSGSGLTIPIFQSKDVHAESGGNGNIYLLDLDHIALRLALPTVYMSTENSHFLLLDSFNFKYMYLTVAQLVADQYNVHGAIKYLN